MTNIISPSETVFVAHSPGGPVRKTPRPLDVHYRHAAQLTAQQEALWNELQKLPNSEQGHGRRRSIERTVAKLENRKHPCLRVWNAHLFPKEAAKAGLVPWV